MFLYFRLLQFLQVICSLVQYYARRIRCIEVLYISTSNTDNTNITMHEVIGSQLANQIFIQHPTRNQRSSSRRTKRHQSSTNKISKRRTNTRWPSNSRAKIMTKLRKQQFLCLRMELTRHSYMRLWSEKLNRYLWRFPILWKESFQKE